MRLLADQAAMRIRLLVFVCSISELLSFQFTGRTTIADEYFQKMLDRIEQTLTHPPRDYGFMVTDVYRSDMNEFLQKLGALKERCRFYTANGNVHYRLERFDPGPTTSRPSLTHVAVFLAGQPFGEAMDNDRGKRVKRIKFRRRSLSVGEVETYIFPSEQEEIKPYKQPFQILANPCFAPLGVTPRELRKLSVVKLPDEDGQRVYEVTRKRNGDLMTLRLVFSPEHGDGLTRSEMSWQGSDGTLREHTLRRVESWHKLAGGVFVPARYTMHQVIHGDSTISLTREISQPAIGNVDSSWFETHTLPEFRGPWDAVWESPERLRNEEDARAAAYAKARARTWWIRTVAVTATIVAAISVVFCLWKLGSKVFR